jgi:prevent-host-death family protein
MESIGIRELRQHASRYIERVERGESIEVTDRGRLVARIVPVTGDTWSDLLASGRVRTPDEPGDVLDEAPLPLASGETPASVVLADMRAHER